MRGRLLFLGSGGSMGIPVIGCHCAVCSSDNAHNKRLRASALVTLQSKQLLIDCGPDFRQQALRGGIDHLDGVLFTHCHHDHTASIDELRAYTMKTEQPVPCLASRETCEDLNTRFAYIFNQGAVRLSLRPKIALQTLESDAGIMQFQGVQVQYFSYGQGGTRVNGFRFGNLAYVTDIKEYSDCIFDALAGTEVLVLSALRFTASPIHLSVDEAIAFARRVGALQTWLTHVGHELDHQQANVYLPGGVAMAYDGLEIGFQGCDD